MKILFSASPKAKTELETEINLIFDTITQLGYSHVDSFIRDVDPKNFYKEKSESSTFFDKVEKSVKKSEICIFETTVPSLGLGHHIYMALSLGKPVITLYRGENAPLMLSELQESKVQVLQYTNDNIEDILEQAISYAKEQADTRFNFFISPRHSNYLDWIAKNRRVPRSVFLRNLIKQDMEVNEEYA